MISAQAMCNKHCLTIIKVNLTNQPILSSQFVKHKKVKVVSSQTLKLQEKKKKKKNKTKIVHNKIVPKKDPSIPLTKESFFFLFFLRAL